MIATRVLGLFAKQPVAGSVKTRLAASTSPGWAARVADAFLRDTLDRLADFPARRVLVHAPDDADLTDLARDRFLLRPQGPGDLGQRLDRFIRGELESGTTEVLVLGADSPTLPLDFLERAFAALARADLVLGPATDGGYYLLGCRRPAPGLFAGIDWGGPRVLSQTVARASDSGLSLAVLPPWYDVDDRDDWHMLAGHLAALRWAGVDPGVPRTEALTRETPP